MRVHYESPPESSLESSLGESPLESSLWEFTMIDLYMTVHLRVDQSKAIIWKIFYLSSFWHQLHLGLHLGLVDSQFKCFIGDFFIKANLSLLATIIAERFTWETSLERFSICDQTKLNKPGCAVWKIADHCSKPIYFENKNYLKIFFWIETW